MEKPLYNKKRKIIKRAIISVVCLLITALLIGPPIAVHIITSGHVDYGVIEDYPLQNMYSPLDFDLTANEMMLTTEDGYNIWASEIYTENPKAIIIYWSGIQQPSVTLPIVIQGVSMGGAIAINAFGQLEDIDGLIAASAYSSFEEVVVDTMRNYHIPSFICAIERPLIHLSLRFTFGDKVNELVPIKQVENIGERPALFIASVNDDKVSAEIWSGYWRQLRSIAQDGCVMPKQRDILFC